MILQTEETWGIFVHLTSTWLPGIKITTENPDQLVAGWVWVAEAAFDSSPSVLWSVVGPVAEPDAVEELTPLDVLTELCWMASLWGLLGTDISSLLSSLSSTETEKQHNWVKEKGGKKRSCNFCRLFLKGMCW